jgi:lipoprotein signal peptidase
MSGRCCCLSNRALFWVLAVCALAADQGTKYYFFAALQPDERWEIIPGVFSLVHQSRLNHGALFGIGNDPNDPAGSALANQLFTGISGLAVVLITAWSFKAPLQRDRLLTVALGLILGGAMGNLYDRLVFGGVRDFIWFYWQPHYPIGWPVFNVADSCLVVGACLLLYQAFFVPEPKDAPAAQEPAAAAPAAPVP